MTQARHSRGIPTLSGVPSTLLVPLVARTRGASIFPWLDPHDTQPRQVVQNSHQAVDPLLQACCWAEVCLSPLTGGPLLGLAHLQITEP
jgi:hypothetical protein